MGGGGVQADRQACGSLASDYANAGLDGAVQSPSVITKFYCIKPVATFLEARLLKEWRWFMRSENICLLNSR